MPSLFSITSAGCLYRISLISQRECNVLLFSLMLRLACYMCMYGRVEAGFYFEATFGTWRLVMLAEAISNDLLSMWGHLWSLTCYRPFPFQCIGLNMKYLWCVRYHPVNSVMHCARACDRTLGFDPPRRCRLSVIVFVLVYRLDFWWFGVYVYVGTNTYWSQNFKSWNCLLTLFWVWEREEGGEILPWELRCGGTGMHNICMSGHLHPVGGCRGNEGCASGDVAQMV